MGHVIVNSEMLFSISKMHFLRRESTAAADSTPVTRAWPSQRRFGAAGASLLARLPPRRGDGRACPSGRGG